MKKLYTLLALAFCLNTNAQIINTVIGTGAGAGTFTCCFGGDGGQATAAEIDFPFEVAVDAAGNLFFSDVKNNRIRKVMPSGIIITFVGNGTGGYSGDGGQATAAELYGPNGIAFDAAGNLFIADYNNNRIRKINTAGIISTVVGGGSSGIGDGGQATAAELFNPTGIAFDATGNLYIGDLNHFRIRKVNTAGIITTIAGNGTGGGYSGDGGQATAALLLNACAIVFDASGNLYFADQGNNCIRMINTSGIINTVIGNGTPAYSGDGGQASAAELNFITGLTIDVAGNFYIADTDNSRIRKVNASGIITTIAGNGTAGFSGDGGQATAAEFNDPYGIAFDATGNLYIADVTNNRIRKVTNATSIGIKQFANNNELNIYPNPAASKVQVAYTGSSAIKEITLYDVLGNEILNTTQTNIDLSTLVNGVYFINLQTTEGLINKKIIVQR